MAMAKERTTMKAEKKPGRVLAPRQLLAAFGGGNIVFWIAAAVLIHVTLIGGLSIGYIRDRWIDPEGAKVRKQAVEAAIKAEADQRLAAERRRLAGTNVVVVATNAVAAESNATVAVTNTAPGGAEGGSETPSDAELMRQRSNTRVVSNITAKASSNEIPREPDSLGISINEINVK
jgi:hypothetical protein